MQSLLDIIGATIIGGLLLVTMFTSLTTIQDNNMILKGEMQIINDLEFISNLIENQYMDKIGYELPDLTEAFPMAVINEVNFNTKIDDGDNTVYLVKIFTGIEDVDYGYPFWIEVTGGTNIGVIWLAEPIEFMYFDVNGIVINYNELQTVEGRARIRSIQTELSVFHGEYNTDSMRVRTLEFRKFFPNLAI